VPRLRRDYFSIRVLRVSGVNMSSEVISIQQGNWTPEQMKLITDVVAKGATKDELKLFLYRCQNMGLDPLKPGQIYFIKYGGGPGTIVVGIEGFRGRAAKTGKLAGIKRGAIRDDKGVVTGAFAEVYRTDWKECAREEVPLAEYNTGKGNWAKMPETMIKKVAECAALRMAFPDELGGFYSKEEMDQAEARGGEARGGVYPEQPPANSFRPQTNAFRIERGGKKGYNVHELNLQDTEKQIELFLALENPSTDDLQTIDRLQEHREVLLNMETVTPLEVVTPSKPQCCGRDLVYSDKKQVYYCGNFKGEGKHIRPISKADYESFEGDVP